LARLGQFYEQILSQLRFTFSGALKRQRVPFSFTLLEFQQTKFSLPISLLLLFCFYFYFYFYYFFWRERKKFPVDRPATTQLIFNPIIWKENVISKIRLFLCWWKNSLFFARKNFNNLELSKWIKLRTKFWKRHRAILNAVKIILQVIY
jgi:hypothetical protein